jgi:ParB-like chromosome segregation protein Spo0J
MRISEIKIGERSRKELGDIGSLARSIEHVGLLHPIVVRSDGTLIAGARRIAAYIHLGRKEIPHVVADSLNEAISLLQAERDENTERKELSPLEALAMAERLEPFEQQAAKERQKKAGFRKSNSITATESAPENFSGVLRGESAVKIASAVGLSRPTLHKIKAVAQAAKEEPEKFASLAKKMDETGKVDSVYREIGRIKNGSSLEEGSKKDPEWRWHKSLHDLYRFMNSTRDAGGINKLCRMWSQQGRGKYVTELKRIIAEIQKWIEALEENVT